jgi:magnesium-transporting ATPase (P-type)
MEVSVIWLVKLILAHLVSDFWWQSAKWVRDREERKIRSQYLYLHILVTGATALLFLGFTYWKIVLFIAILHGLTDLLKSYLKANFTYFVIDQLLHLLVIFLSWIMVFDEHRPNIQTLINFYQNGRFWVFATAVFFLTIPASIIIGYATKQWAVPAGLKNAGKYIGIIERLIICVLVYLGQYEAIGLLITGKSILRYNSTNEEAKTEYLLVGTLLSISIAFAVGFVLKLVLK